MRQSPLQLAELIREVLVSGDVYGAAALHGAVDAADRGRLEALMFRRRRDALALAGAEFTPPSVLQALAARDDPAIRVRVARNPRTLGPVLASLADSAPDGRILRPLARHPNTPATVLRQIAETADDLEALKGVCANPCASREVLRIVAACKPGRLDRQIALNPRSDPELLEDLWRRGDPPLRVALLRHPNCPRSLLDRAAEGDQAALLRQLAGSDSTSPAILSKLVRHRDRSVRRMAAANPGLPVQELQRLWADPSTAVRRAVAARKDLPAACAVRLAADPDRWVRQWLSRNPTTPDGLLEQLAEDDEPEVRRGVARNPRCPAALLERLARDPEGWVRAAVAYRDDVPTGLLKALACDEDIDVLSGVARNPRTRQTDLQRLARHASADVRRGVVLNRAAGREALLKLLAEPYPLHRLLLVAQPNLLGSDKWRLRHDPDPRVRFAVFAGFAARLVRGENPGGTAGGCEVI